MSNESYRQRDLDVLWHPCTQMQDHEGNLPLVPIRRGHGVWLEDFDGNRYIDAISSWWVNLFGHANPRINQAIAAQAENLEHVILAGCTHEPVITLSERVVSLTPPDLSRCFYADCGSAAVEIALKMSFHYWLNCGYKNKTRFINISNSYHGETLGALSVGDVAIFKETYAPLLMQPITAKSPDSFYCGSGESWEQHAIRMFADMEAVLEKHAETTCAVIVEPLVQCAGNMRMYHPTYLKLLRQACDKYQVHLIADEIAVGFGRTGTLFACEQADITPDLLLLGKGLTGGYLPLCICVTTEKIYAAFYADYTEQKAFLHSHSYTGNPLACAAALATLDIFDEDDVIEQNKVLSNHMAKVRPRFEDHPHVGQVRQTGMILAIEMVADKSNRTSYPWRQRRGLKVYRHGLSHGTLLRPLGDVIYFMPPYVISLDEIDQLAQVAWDGVNIATSS